MLLRFPEEKEIPSFSSTLYMYTLLNNVINERDHADKRITNVKFGKSNFQLLFLIGHHLPI